MLLTNLLVANDLEEMLLNAMKTYKVPVVGYAVIDNNKISNVKTLSIDPNIKVSNETLFQAASISKSMTAYATLKFLSDKKLNINLVANNLLKNWKIPTNKYTKNHAVKIKDLMNMSGCISVSGFAGYTKNQALPNNIEILNGSKPANNAKVEVFCTPESQYFYSGGAFQILEQIINDNNDINFKPYLNKDILPKLGMNSSRYEYPLIEKDLLSKVVDGYTGWDGQKVEGGWHNYACSGAGGMWSTPTDLAKFAINISDSLHGKANGLIPQKIAKQMLTRYKNTDFGLGVVVGGKNKNLYFWKAGHNYGYHSLMIMFPNQGKGIAIMTNSETGDLIINYLVAYIAHEHKWPYYFPYFDELIPMPNFQ